MSHNWPVKGTDLVIYGGYETSFNMYERGLFLRMEVSHKVVRRDHILSMINNVYNSHSNRSKEEKREIVVDMLRNKIILANYGNFRYYKVADVIFGKDALAYVVDGSDQTLYDYYKKKYGLKITKAN